MPASSFEIDYGGSKDDAITDPSTSGNLNNNRKSTSISSGGNTLYGISYFVSLPFLFVVHIGNLVMRFLTFTLPESVVNGVSNFSVLTPEEEQAVKEAPAVQKQLKKDLVQVGSEQDVIKRQVDDLTVRVQKLKERREKWSKKAEAVKSIRETKTNSMPVISENAPTQ